MKHFYRQNYYELLEVSPNASMEEVTRAYELALEAFNPDSVAIYSLFDTEERQGLLLRIQEAYRVLSSGRTRREYDRRLEIESQGGAEGETESLASITATEAGLLDGRQSPAEHLPLTPLVKEEGEPLILSTGQILRGSDLKRLRESRGVTLDELARRTRVGKENLMALEADQYHRLPARVYVKGFLKAYARALLLDGEEICQAYLAGMGR